MTADLGIFDLTGRVALVTGAVHGYAFDVTDEAQVTAAVARIADEVGGVDVLVNNAGTIKRTPMTRDRAAGDGGIQAYIGKARPPGCCRGGGSTRTASWGNCTRC